MDGNAVLTSYGNSLTTVFYGLYSYGNMNSNLMIVRNGMTILDGGLDIDADGMTVDSEWALLCVCFAVSCCHVRMLATPRFLQQMTLFWHLAG